MEVKEFNRLLRRAKFDSKAIEALYNYYYTKLISFFGKKYTEDLAKDAVQDFFLKLLDISDTQKHIEYPTAWVYTCVDNICKKYLSKENQLIEWSETYDVTYELHMEEKVLVDELLSTLSEMERTIIYMKYWEGYSLKEIAIRLGKRPQNIRQAHRRAIKKIEK